MRTRTAPLAALVLLTALLTAGCADPGPTGQAGAAAGEMTIGLVFDVGGRGDNGFNDAAAAGAERAAEEFGVQIRYIEPESGAEREAALERLVRQDLGLVIGVGFLISGTLSRLAREHPRMKFAGVDFTLQKDSTGRAMLPPDNLAALVFREEEGAFLVGALAGAVTETGRIGFVGGMKSALIERFQAGFEAGVERVCPGCRVFVAYAGTTPAAFTNPLRGRVLARAQYRAGADIIFHAAGETGLGVIRAAVENDRLVIGVDIDQHDLAPNHVLTSMVKRVDVAVYNVIRRVVQGRFDGGVQSFGLAENGVGYVYNAENRAMIPDSARVQVETLRHAIIAGLVSVPRVP